MAASFAKIDVSNKVINVLVVDPKDLLDKNGNEVEKLGRDMLHSTFGGTWIQTSHTGAFRKNPARIGGTYDKVRDAFIAQKPFPSWSLDNATCRWMAPTEMPDDSMDYTWDEPNTKWIEISG